MGRRRDKRNATENGSSNLPCEIIQDILSRLPVNSLLRFNCVCKSWNARISDDPDFARMQHTRSRMNPSRRSRLLVAKKKSWDPVSRRYRVDQLHASHGEETLRFSSLNLEFGIMLCSCEGLVLVLDKVKGENKVLYVWNPFLRKYTTIPCPNDGFPFHLDDTIYGLCYDSSPDDYKVVVITTKSYVVYSFKNGSWTERKPFDCEGFTESPCVFVNGVLHWVLVHNSPSGNKSNIFDGIESKSTNTFRIYRHRNPNYGRRDLPHYFKGSDSFQDDEYHHHEILCFDPKEDKVTVNMVPRPDVLNETNVIYLTTINGCLGLYCFNNYVTKCTIWLWEGSYHDYYEPRNANWVEFRIIDTLYVPARFSDCYGFHIKPVSISEDMEMVFHINYSKIFIYDIKEGRGKNVDDGDFMGDVVTCVDSLLLPRVGDKQSSEEIYKVSV